jgi:endonuclease III
MLANLRKQLDELDEPLQATYERLISIMRSMSLANTKSKVLLKKPGDPRQKC